MRNSLILATILLPLLGVSAVADVTMTKELGENAMVPGAAASAGVSKELGEATLNYGTTASEAATKELGRTAMIPGAAASVGTSKVLAEVVMISCAASPSSCPAHLMFQGVP